MPVIKFIQADGREFPVNVPLGSSVMQGAVDSMIDGILAECGGGCSCATCLVYVDEAWMPQVGAAVDMEREMIDATRQAPPNARLSCQIEVTPELEGLVVRVPEEQA